MRAVILALAVASAGVLGGYGGAQAQDKPAGAVIVEPPVVADAHKPLGPRVYGYYEEVPVYRQGAPVVELERPHGPGGCGEFFYWNGARCVDARNKL